MICVYAIVPARGGMGRMAGGDLRTIVTGRFAAVVGGAPNVADRSREALALQLLAHQRIIERITPPLLPVKFATSLPDEACVHEVLQRGGPALAAAFERVADCVQVEILVKWDVEAVFAEIAKEEAIAGLKKRWEQQVGPSDEALRAVIGGLVKQSLERRRSTLAASLFGTLQRVTIDAVACPATADQVALHAVLLMKADRLRALDGLLEELDATLGGRLAFRYVGPMAPYSFATVEIDVVDPAVLTQARRLLGVGPSASLAEVRTAYRHAAKSLHPDAAGAGDGTSMAALGEACRLLSLHAEAGDSSQDRSVLVSVRRQEVVFHAAA